MNQLKKINPKLELDQEELAGLPIVIPETDNGSAIGQSRVLILEGGRCDDMVSVIRTIVILNSFVIN